jgi:hypothetical protein
MFSNIDALLDRVPAYSAFVTVDELYAKAAALAADNPGLARLEVMGKSTRGSEIPMLTIGSGEVSILVFACPHPNEPIGAMMTYFLMEELIADPSLRKGRTWHIMPCVDPDGTRLNEGWFRGPFNIRNYARDFYRPRSQDQVEWTFPVQHKTLNWTTPKPETQALMAAILASKPDVMYSLHNAGFGGAYYYISRPLPEQCYDELRRIPPARGIELSLGEPEMPWVEELSPAVYKSSSIVDSYEYYAKYAQGDPAQYIVAGAGSAEWAESQGEVFSLVTEVPYFMSAKISDQTPISVPRGQVIIAGLKRTREVYTMLQRVLGLTEGKLVAGDAPLFRDAVAMFTTAILKGLDSQERWATETPGMETPATVAQEADSLYVGIFYNMLIASMLARAIRIQLASEPDTGLAALGAELEETIDALASDIEKNLNYEVVPIRNLVQVQYGALLAVLESMGM